jgi:large subunit ribosomal protein L21
MYAIVNIAGQQFKVEKDQQIIVHRLATEEGKSVDFKDLVMVDDKGKIKMGADALKGAFISAKVISHLRGDKVIIFKKKRRKGYQKQTGHRQDLTKIQIESISLKSKESKATKEA